MIKGKRFMLLCAILPMLSCVLPQIAVDLFCGEIKAGYQDIDITPLYNVQIETLTAQAVEDLIDLSIFDRHDGSGVYVSGYFSGSQFQASERLPEIGNTSIEVHMDLVSDIQTSEEIFQFECNRDLVEDSTDFITGGSEGNRYCISYVVELRASPERFCQPTDEYLSYLVFQKGRLVITILEYAPIPDSTGKNHVILLLAQEFSK